MLQRKLDGGRNIRDIREVKTRGWNENASTRPNGLRENAETAIRVGGLDLPERRQEVYQ